MREIKFRAWDGEKMHNLIPTKGGTLGMLNDLYEEEYWKVMQFTGLKDSEGVEIYEGDVLQGEWGNQREDTKDKINGPIVFRNGCFIWHTWLKHFTDFDDSRNIGIRWVEEFSYGREYREVINIKIIGNIHQNPELLE